MIGDMKTIENTMECSKTKHLSPFFPHPEDVLFFDIETTGFSAKSACVYLIGCAFYSRSGWKIRQYFAQDRTQEKELLEDFCSFASTFSSLIHFNGTAFDVPFLQERCKKHRLPPFSPGVQTDIYKCISPYKNLLRLPGCRQKQLEESIGLFREDPFTGGQLIELYRAFEQRPDERLLEVLLLHNREDLSGMLSIYSLMAVPALFSDARFTPVQMQMQRAEGGDELAVVLDLPAALPFPIACHSGISSPWRYYLSGRDRTVRLKVPVRSGELKYFYPDYKNYSYLPDEDRAIHKSVAVYVDKAHRMPATAATCYVKKDGSFLPWPGTAPENAPVFREDYRSKELWIEAGPSFFSDDGLKELWIGLLLKALSAAGKRN